MFIFCRNFLKIAIFLCFFGGCEQGASNEEQGYKSPLGVGDKLSSKDRKQTKIDFGEFVFSKFEGKPASLEPLEIEKCYGQQYSEQHVRSLLDSLYLDGLPVSGVMLFLGLGDESTAIKNKEFRFRVVRRSKDVRHDEIFRNVLGFSYHLYSLLGFEAKEFILTKESLEGIKVHADIPIVYIEQISADIEAIDSASVYRKAYWNMLVRKGKVDEKIQEMKNKLKKKLESNLDVNSQNSVSTKLFSGAVDYSNLGHEVVRERFINLSWYGNYMYQSSVNTLVTDKDIKDVSKAFNVSLMNFYIGSNAGFSSPNSSGLILTTLTSAGLKEGGDMYEPSLFDKTLFLAIYQRIKPVSMRKNKFIEAAITVMSPCLV